MSSVGIENSKRISHAIQNDMAMTAKSDRLTHTRNHDFPCDISFVQLPLLRSAACVYEISAQYLSLPPRHTLPPPPISPDTVEAKSGVDTVPAPVGSRSH